MFQVLALHNTMQCVKPFARTPCGLGARAPIRVSRIGLSQRTLATRTRAEPEKEKQTSRASVVRDMIDSMVCGEKSWIGILRSRGRAKFSWHPPRSQDDEVLPTDEIAKLAALRRQQQANFAQDSNIVQVGGSCACGFVVASYRAASEGLAAASCPATPPWRMHQVPVPGSALYQQGALEEAQLITWPRPQKVS